MDFAMLNEFEDDCVYFRSGKSGDWRSHFTQDMSRKFDEMIKIKLKKDNFYFNEEQKKILFKKNIQKITII